MMLGRRSRLQTQSGGGARVSLTRRDRQMVRFALSEAATTDVQAVQALDHAEDRVRYARAASRLVVALTGHQLEVLRTALRAHIGARPVSDTTPARRLYDRLPRPRRPRA